MNDQPTTLIEAIRYFSDPDICQTFMASLRWPNGVISCPTCGREDVRYIATRRLWECKDKHPKRQFSVKVGTIFEDSPIGLDKWLAAIWMIANDKNGVSSYEMSRALGVTQKTAWFMLHRIRLAMQSYDFTKLNGTVEVDETFIGGRARNMHRSKRPTGTGYVGKTAVMGLLERHGPDGHSTVLASVVPSTSRATLNAKVRQHVQRGAEVMSDAWRGYNGLEREYIRGVIDHAEKYVDGQIHTNGIENFWTLLKRAVRGTYVSIEPFHLFRYVDEEVFRFNSRKALDGQRFASLASRVAGKRLTYKNLTATTQP
jgi:transposase-like protein